MTEDAPRLSSVQAETFIDIMHDSAWFINGSAWTGSKSFGFKNWRTLNWFVFDTETTGLPLKDEWKKLPTLRFGIIQFYGRLLCNRKETETVARLINPTVPIEEEAISAHGITDEMVQDEPTFEEQVDDILEPILKSDILIAFNARFDIRSLIYELCCLGMSKTEIGDILNIPFLDILIWERERKGKVNPKMSGQTLHDVCKRFGVKTIGQVEHERASLHDASTDTDALINLTRKYAPSTPWTIKDVVEIQALRMKEQDAYIFKKYGPKDDK